jgi:glycine/D-amino acid oxidase-like deaminating enzyme
MWRLFMQQATGNEVPMRWSSSAAAGTGWPRPITWRSVHGVRRVAVLEKGWIGGGNAGRNTTIVRSNYMLPGNREFYEHSLKLWENLSHELNYNVMFSQRAHVNLCSRRARSDALARRYNTMRLTGSDGEWWDKDRLLKPLPIPHLDRRALSDDRRLRAAARRHGAP